MEDKDGILSDLLTVKSAGDLSVGDVVYVELDAADGIDTQGYPCRLKYVVVSGCKTDRKEIAAVLINSENDYSSSEEWQNEQYLLDYRNYNNFLDYDSWLDCSEIKELKVRKIVSKKAQKKGHLNDYDLRVMMQKLKESDFIDNHIKKVYGINAYQLPEI